ncbi:MAG: DUF4097 domain-containing protein, partial [Chloroflexaceae bacterium]|nr:DUF4097 domain-containing protein [Chloroflexaceae bacterium]
HERNTDTFTVPEAEFERKLPPNERHRQLGLMLIVFGVIWLVFLLAGRINFFGAASGFAQETQEIPAQTLTGTRLVVSGVSDQVELSQSDGPGITVSGTKYGYGWNNDGARAALEQLDVAVTQDGDTVRVEVRRPVPNVTVFGRSPYADLRIQVPSGVQLDVSLVSGEVIANDINANGRVGTVSGDIRVDNAQGNLTFDSTSGQVSLSNLQGELTVNTISGDIDLVQGAVQKVTVTTTSGGVDLDGVRGPVEVESVSGDVQLQDASNAQLDIETTSGEVEFAGSLANSPHSITTLSGDVRLRLPADSNLQLEASSLSGDLESNLSLRDMVQERRELKGTLGNGGPTLTISTTSGNVQVNGL